MAEQIRLVRVFLAAPSDVKKERAAAEELIADWNVAHGPSLDMRAELIHWKTHTHPDAGAEAQEIINRQALDDCDVVVGIFWSRFGSPTGTTSSGTESEIRRSIAAGKQVLVYFADRPLPPSKQDPTQYQRIRKFKSEFDGLYRDYSSLSEFKGLLRQHLAVVLSSFRPAMSRLRAAVGVVARGKRVLMVRRRQPEKTLEWQFPAGIIKPTESGREALIDEVASETGVTCRVVRPIGTRIHPVTRVELEYYLCEYVSGRARNADPRENAEVRWVEAAKVGKYVTSGLYNGVKKALASMK
jgi:8-oxo-dGTP pyrophosphatase MutT (NUDIX family)